MHNVVIAVTILQKWVNISNEDARLLRVMAERFACGHGNLQLLPILRNKLEVMETLAQALLWLLEMESSDQRLYNISGVFIPTHGGFCLAYIKFKKIS